MHILLVTGPGGAGRTTTAAATAAEAAGRGLRVLLLSGDRGSPLAAVVDQPGPPGAAGASDPVAVPVTLGGARVWTAEIDSGAQFRDEFADIQERGAAVLGMLGARPLAEEELTELPGAEQFALLRTLRRVGEAAGYDLVVVDMPPIHQSLAVLALPAQLHRYLARLLPPERQAARALRPVLAQLAGVPMPAQRLYESAARWSAELTAVQAVLDDPGTSVRIVAEPGPAATEAVRGALLGLALHQVPIEGLIANRVLPRGSADTWLAALAAQQDKGLDEWATSYPDLLRGELAHLGHDPRGRDDLERLAGSLPAPGRPRRVQWPVEDLRASEGVLVWRLRLPGAVRAELGLVRRGDELVLTAGSFHRIVSLPSVLRRCSVSGAGLSDGELRIRFTPDPALWPKERGAGH
ncbi:ArsA family ATPase [Streptomyces sp. NPDC006879]|uniref:ArsA family ATPase n=1 Tax=Streptomyces sp. NPDC006879 TaxID=3364767 RepID=UPI0036D16547